MEGEKARERKLLRVGGMILVPDQSAASGVVGEVCGIALRRRVSRLGSKGVLSGRIILHFRGVFSGQ